MSFDNYAQQWDTEMRIQRAQKVAEEIRKKLKRNGYESALEFGCGTGLVGFNLTDLFDKLLMIDDSKGMIEVLEKKKQHYGIEHMMPLKIDLTQGDALDQKVDVIFSSMVFHHIPDIENIVTVFYNQLKETGEICIVDLDEDDGRFHAKYPDFNGHKGFAHEELKNTFERVGFKNVEVYTFYKDHKKIEDEEVPYSLFLLKAEK